MSGTGPTSSVPANRWRSLKRALDIFLSFGMVLATAPLLLTLAIAVLLGLGRPIFFIQKRAGRFNEPFSLIKFRSMTDARDSGGLLLPDADRTNRFGRILRRSRLDELPELWNVFRGDMSIIGPRPLLPDTIEQMGANGSLRSSVRPGLTGWAQISGNVKLPNEDKLALDLWYINNRCLRLDILIIFKTIHLMLFGDRINTHRISQANAERTKEV
jgi:lipopolysaccharide/colanic/teichoic acid biosynthesis glycosyltransferase